MTLSSLQIPIYDREALVSLLLLSPPDSNVSLKLVDEGSHVSVRSQTARSLVLHFLKNEGATEQRC